MLKKLLRKIMVAFYKLTISGLKKGPHVTRYYMYNYLSKFKEPRSENLKVLSLSGSQNLAVLLGFSADQITDVTYPDVDIFNLPFEDGEFDCIVSDQVLEHIEGNPQHAIDETFRVLKHNGLALHTTCFINPMHGCPDDFWRFSPQALKLLVKKHGVMIDCNGWGNKYVWFHAFLGLRFQPIPHWQGHIANRIANFNDKEWPVVTWVLAKKKNILNAIR